MALVNGQFWYRWADDCFLLTIISWGLLFHVDAWTYHYGTKSDLTWEDARTFCQTWYTDLVAIQNKEEIAYLNEVLPKHSKYYWIGIRKINNTWTWVGTRKALTKEAENWAYREPNNRLSNQDCVEIYIKRDFEAGKWNDEPCGKKKRALCYKASCQPSSCNERSECVETIGNYTCECYPGFYGPWCENVVKCNLFGPLHQALLMNCTHPLEQFSYRSHCSFRCDKGFTITGPVNLQCLSSGQWTAEVPLCAAVQCQPLNIPVHGNFSCIHIHGEFHYQSSCDFKCQEGFLINGAGTTICEASGTWSAPEPICQVEQCQSIQPPARGTMDCVNPIGYYSYNSTCNFACEVGFELSDSQPLICRASGQWTTPVPTCQAIQCQSLEASAHGNTTCVHPHGEFQYQSSCTFLCTKGFQLLGKEVTECTASGKWTAPAPVCQAVQCQPLNILVHGNFSCIHIHGEFHYQSSCDFKCQEGFLINGAGTTMCEASGTWSAPEPICQVMQCHHLQNPKNGEMACSHPFAEFAYQSTCQFVCEPGFLLAGANTTFCLATRHWSSPLPACQVIECPNLDAPQNGELNCSHPHGSFAYNSSCAFSCDMGFVRIGTNQLQCTDLGKWTAATPSCEAAKCPFLHRPANGHLKCLHPHSHFAYGSTCNFSCNAGFQLVGLPTLACTALGNWTQEMPFCKAVQCPPLKNPENGKENCSDPYGHFAYYSSCMFSCNFGFELAGSEKLNCTDQGNWTGDTPICEALKCPELQAPKNGQLKCSQSYGNFTYNSSCIFSCDMGFKKIGSKRLNCTATGEWTGFAPFCEAIKCPPLKEAENMKKNCSHPWGHFSYSSACRFYCMEGFILNGTSRMQCQPDGRWSAEMPVCQENAAIYLKQLLLYTGGITASLIAVMISGGLIVLAIKRLGKREERKKLLSHTSDLGVPGTYSNSAFDSVS
ncbi:P-selectin-like isoform X1 [Crotalus tigris]|uniref:P-selectin-like isoform X1 n=1 Tax=Crotalus tigris TaxID=88082 RepID=UPI00192F265E|nr:P-selectin-like isoform X1 [Crotalus tigris]